MQVSVNPMVETAIQHALHYELPMLRINFYHLERPPPLTVTDARRMIECLRENHRFDTLDIHRSPLHDAAVLNVFREGLATCPAVTTVSLFGTQLGNEGLERLLPSLYSVRLLFFGNNSIQGQRGGEVIRDLLRGNNTLIYLHLCFNPIGPEGSIGLGVGLAGNNNHRLKILNLSHCHIGNDGLASLLSADGMINNSLTDLDLSHNNIEGAEGGRQVSLLLQRFSAIKVLKLRGNNRLGPLGAHALAPGLAAAIHLESLDLSCCWLGNNGVASVVPDGHENRSLAMLNLSRNTIQGLVGVENVVGLASRCTNLDEIYVDSPPFNPDHRRRLDLLLDRKRMCTEAQALGGSPFSVLFQFVEKAHHHEHGLSAIFVILHNDGEDRFYTANNRAIE